MMYQLICELLSDKKGGMVFRCFDITHFCCILIVFCAISLVAFYLRNKSECARQRAIAISINFAFVLYVLDFFLMPFAYREIDVEKLPFHVCTAMCIMSFWSRHNRFLGKFKAQFALLAFVSNIVYLIYPAGVMWHQVHPLSYRVIQTLSFHGAMVIYGALVLLYEDSRSNKRWLKNLLVIILMTLWAVFGNLLYTGETYGFNWFFVRQDPFYIISADIAPWIMPIINIVIFLIVEIGISAVCDCVKKAVSNKQK